MVVNLGLNHFQLVLYAHSLTRTIFHLKLLFIKLYLGFYQAVRMKSSKSQKNITIITDRRIDSDYSVARDRGSSKGFLTCKNQSKTIINHIPQPMSCKNLTEEADMNENRSRSASAQKHRRQRSTSLQSRQQCALGQENRKKQLDYLCFQRFVNIFKKYLLQRQQYWNLESLCYGQLLKLLWLCRFVPYSFEQQFIENNEQSQLKKVYLLWLSIANKKYINFKDFLNFVQIIQNVNVEQQKVDSLIFSLESQVKSLCFKKYQSSSEDPNFTFFLKRIELKRDKSSLVFDQAAREKIQTQFKSFKLNKLKNSGVFECVKVEEPQLSISKKSSQLAEQKRKKIQEKIRQKKPHVENINLLDLLSYRQRDHFQAKKAQVPAKKKSIVTLKKGELKKQIEFLSRPKAHFQERKQDQIEFQKEEQQYTFHPKINMYKLNNQEKVMQVKNVDKVLVRMKQARKQKQQKENIIQKGWSNINKIEYKQAKPFGKNKSYHQVANLDKQNMNTQKQAGDGEQPQKRDPKLSKYEVSKDYLRIPILYIDVNIEEGKKERIIIYDNDKAQTLANQFGEKHKLSEETIKRLELLLQQQMDTVLARIDQQTDDECSILY